MNLARTSYSFLLALVLGLACVPAFGASISMNSLMQLLIYIVIISLIFYAVWWFIGFAAVPEPFGKIIRIVVGLICLIVVVNLLLGLIGSPMFTVSR